MNMEKEEYTIVVPSKGMSERALINPGHIIEAAYLVCYQCDGAGVEIWQDGKRVLTCNIENAIKFNVKWEAGL